MRYIIVLFYLPILFSCQNNETFEGDFSSCLEGFYIELNISGDSLRISSHESNINRWTKFKRNRDTIHFLAAGEWIDSTLATFEFKNEDNLIVHSYESDFTTDFKRIKENINYDDSTKHKQGILRRFKKSDCYSEVIEFNNKHGIKYNFEE